MKQRASAISFLGLLCVLGTTAEARTPPVFVSWGEKTPEQGFKPEDRCPDAQEFAQRIGDASLADALDSGEIKAFGSATDACRNIYNGKILREIRLMHEELEALKKKHPNEPNLQKRGGGNDVVFGLGVRVGVQLGKESLGPVSPNATSHCNGAIYTVITRMLNRLGNGMLFDEMSPEQRLNFNPWKMLPMLKRQRGPLKEGDAPYLENRGFYGVVGNSGNGFRDVRRFNPEYPISTPVSREPPKRGDVSGHCPGDIMQIDRQDPKTLKMGFGHSVVYLGTRGSKTYFWSSNGSTEGYGVTCEDTDQMIPKTERITQPWNILGIPPFTGQAKLKRPVAADPAERAQQVEEEAETLQAVEVAKSRLQAEADKEQRRRH